MILRVSALAAQAYSDIPLGMAATLEHLSLGLCTASLVCSILTNTHVSKIVIIG